MLKKTFYIILLCLLALGMQARERTEDDMQSIALQHFSHRAVTRGEQAIPEVRELARRSSYVVYGQLRRQGFVVVAKDKAFDPILAYSETAFDMQDMADGLKWWLNAIDESLQYRQRPAATRSYQAVENFVETKWGQGSPYNAMTPVINGKNAPTGCVATAMAQILNYYKYPERSEGISYYTVGEDDTDIRYEFNTTFRWDCIKTSYVDNSTYDDTAVEAVGELMRDCGYSVKMHYGQNSSGAQTTNATLGFTRNMGLQEGYLHYAVREFYTDNEWMEIIQTELTAGRPILYGGVDGNSGHAFVFSGIAEDGKVYVNWGWDGKGDGYYDISDLAPAGQGITSSDHYNSGQQMIYGLTPTPDVSSLHPKYSEWAFEEGSYTLAPSAMAGRLSISVESYCYNFYYTTFRGKIDLVLVSQENGETYTFNVYETEGVPVYYGLSIAGLPSNKRLPNISSLPAGKYTAFLGSKSSRDTEYQPLRCKEGAIAYELAKDEDGSVNVSGQIPFVTAICQPKAGQQPAEAVYDLQGRRVQNNSNARRKGIYIIGGKKVMAR